jgi:hypothetical protein
MGEKTSWCGTMLQISICTETELRVTCGNPAEIRQKIVSAQDGPADRFWTFSQLEDIACFLHDAREFRSEKFSRYHALIMYLGWNIAHNANREQLVSALHLLMRAWLRLCQEDAMCIPPPSLAVLENPQQRKILGTIEALKRELVRTSAENAFLSQQVTGPIEQTDLQRALIKFREDSELQRVNA